MSSLQRKISSLKYVNKIQELENINLLKNGDLLKASYLIQMRRNYADLVTSSSIEVRRPFKIFFYLQLRWTEEPAHGYRGCWQRNRAWVQNHIYSKVISLY